MRGTVFSCTLEVQEVRYYCSVEMFTIKFHPSAYFALLGKIDSSVCLQNCLFLLAAYFAQNSASKFGKAYSSIGARPPFTDHVSQVVHVE